MTKKLRNLTQLKIDPGYRRYLLLPNIILAILYMFTISQLSAKSIDEPIKTSEEMAAPIVIASYEISDANTSVGSCPGAHGNEIGVILQKGNPNFPVTGNYNAWRVKDMLILDEYDNGTAKIWGNVIDEHGNVGIVDMNLSSKTQSGNTWTAQCYIDGIVGTKTFYRSFYGTITVAGVAYIVEPNQTDHHFILADGAGLKPGQFGLGAWTAGSFGVGGEWFGNLGPNCLLNVDAGDDIEVCNEDTVELTATVTGISECQGGCEYPIESVARCFDSNNMSDVWLNNVTNANKGFVTSSSKFETFDDGTARYTAIGSNGLDNIEVDVTFSGYTTSAPQGSPKENDCQTYNTSNWVYWTQTSGTIKTDNHGTLTVSRAGPSMQMGIGADVTRNGFGASGWLTISGGDGFYTAGDINIKLGNCTPIVANSSANYMWSTNNGSIIGNANQKTITVDKSGTYNVTVSDCESCEASDSVNVTLSAITVDAGEDIEVCNEDTVELTAIADDISECVGGCEYPIESVARCFDSNNMSDVWLNNITNANKGFVTSSSKFETFDDGTARYTAIGSNGLDNIEVDILFSGYTTNAPLESPKENNCDTYDTSDWVYWTQTSGIIKTENHGTLIVSRAGPSMQMGNGADVTRTGFGASGWLTISGGDGFYTAGDVNIKLGECIPLDSNSSANYMWTTDNGNIIGDANQMTITVDKTGTYNVTVSNCESCEAVDSVNVTMNEANADAGDDQIICKGDEATLTATGGGTYLWSNGETTASIKVSPTAETTYTVTVTSDEGCEDTDEVIVSLNPDVTADAGADVAICKGDEVELTATGGGTYLWSNGETTASIKVSPTAETTYSVTVTSDEGCEDTDEVIVSLNPDVAADAGADVTICKGDEVMLTATGGGTYLWSNGETTASIKVSPTADTTYSVTVTSNEGCEDTDEVIVSLNPDVTADAGADVAICKGDEVMLTATGGGTYLWSNGETTASIKVSPTAETTYTVTVTSNEGCEASDEVIVSLNPDVTADAGADVDICKGDEIMLNATGGGNYLWSTGETTASIKVSPTADTTYTVTVTSNEGCEDTDEVIVTVGDATADAGNDLEICKGDEVILTVDGDGTYLWSTGETSQSIAVSPEYTTEYSVTVTNGNCEATDTVMVTVGNATADAGADQTICEGEEVMLSVAGEGDYLWSTGEITQTIMVSPETTTEYSVIVTNGNCEAMDEVMVNVDNKVIIGDYVWLDENRNGIQDDGATGIDGVSVKLYHCDGDLVDSTVTNDDGSYQFEVCPDSGDYYIVFGEVPEDLKFTTSNEGSDSMDSDANASGVTSCFTITDEDDLTIDAGLVEICDINLEVIDEVKICTNELLELTATLTDNTEECEGGCVYPVIEKGKCADPTPDNEVLLTSFVNGKKVWHRFKASEQRFETFEDGSARYTATATDGVDNIEVDVTFTGHSMNPGPMGPKANECQDYDMSDWEYWSTWSGTVTSQNHGVFTLSMKGAYFQMGIGADVTKSGFGASGWFFANGGDGYYVDGDINIALDECIEKSATFEWTTADGNIISDANQKTITIDRPGTYVIKAVNCIDCVAVETIVVSEDILCSKFAKAISPKMLSVYPVPVKSGGTLTIEFDMDDNKTVSGIKSTSLKASIGGNSNKESVTMIIYDMTGRVIGAPRMYNLINGKAVIYLDLDYMTTGKYIVKAMGGTWSDSKNIIVK